MSYVHSTAIFLGGMLSKNLYMLARGKLIVSTTHNLREAHIRMQHTLADLVAVWHSASTQTRKNRARYAGLRPPSGPATPAPCFKEVWIDV